MHRLLPVAGLLGLLLACHNRSHDHGDRWDQDSTEVEMPLPAWEVEARAAHEGTPIGLRGRVVDLAGAAIPDASVTLQDHETTTAADGTFAFEGLLRHNALLRVTAAGHQPEAVMAWLDHAITRAEVDLDQVHLVGAEAVRFVFCGDTSLGRRYLDPLEVTPRDALPVDNPEALIAVSEPLAGSRAVFDHVRGWLADAEVLVLNLETVVTDLPDTPHPTKDYVIFTLPESLEAVTELGVDWISLGNNHVYDYMEAGVGDTLQAVGATGIPSGGLGYTPQEAFAPSGLDAGGASWSFIAASSVTGRQHPIDYQADDHSGGAADLEDETRVARAIEDARAAGEIPIAFLHTGAEYTEAPTPITMERFDRVAADGAALIVAAHPHTAQGFGWHDGVLAAWSLGNFAFDQDRLETYQSVVLLADLMPDGRPISVRAAPLYVEDYVPRLLGGELGDLLTQRMARDSTATVVPGHGARVVLDEAVTDEVRTLQVDVEIGPESTGLLDLRPLLGDAEWLSAVHGPAGLIVDPGHDRLGFGGFEDLDVDDDILEISRWYLGGSSKVVCLSGAARGMAGLCSYRSSEHHDDGLWNFRERVRVAGDALATPNKDQWLVALVRSEAGGDLDVKLTFQASEGDTTFGEQELLLAEAGSFGWTTVHAPILMPPDEDDPLDPTANARAVRLSFRHHPPPQGEGWIFLDDVAVVSWDPGLEVGDGARLGIGPTRFLRVHGAPGAQRLTLEITRRRWAPGSP